LSILDLAHKDPKTARRLALILAFGCTVLLATAQILMKGGSQGHAVDDPIQLVIAILHSPKLFLGYALLGISTVVMVLALKYGELSIIYPVIALTYVWVTGLSVLIYGEVINPWKVAGISTVMLGVAVLGRSGHK
jgi:drug/metabolite transporter (DMT)-like permease